MIKITKYVHKLNMHTYTNHLCAFGVCCILILFFSCWCLLRGVKWGADMFVVVFQSITRWTLCFLARPPTDTWWWSSASLSWAWGWWPPPSPSPSPSFTASSSWLLTSSTSSSCRSWPMPSSWLSVAAPWAQWLASLWGWWWGWGLANPPWACSPLFTTVTGVPRLDSGFPSGQPPWWALASPSCCCQKLCGFCARGTLAVVTVRVLRWALWKCQRFHEAWVWKRGRLSPIRKCHCWMQKTWGLIPGTAWCSFGRNLREANLAKSSHSAWNSHMYRYVLGIFCLLLPFPFVLVSHSRSDVEVHLYFTWQWVLLFTEDAEETVAKIPTVC